MLIGGREQLGRIGRQAEAEKQPQTGLASLGEQIAAPAGRWEPAVRSEGKAARDGGQKANTASGPLRSAAVRREGSMEDGAPRPQPAASATLRGGGGFKQL